VNNLYTITSYELHNKVASRAYRARRVECVELCRVETWRDEPSGIWAIAIAKVIWPVSAG